MYTYFVWVIPVFRSHPPTVCVAELCREHHERAARLVRLRQGGAERRWQPGARGDTTAHLCPQRCGALAYSVAGDGETGVNINCWWMDDETVTVSHERFQHLCFCLSFSQWYTEVRPTVAVYCGFSSLFSFISFDIAGEIWSTFVVLEKCIIMYNKGFKHKSVQAYL